MLNRRVFVAAAVSATGMMAAAKAVAIIDQVDTDLADIAQPDVKPWNQQYFRQLQGDTVFLKDAQGQALEAQLVTVADMGSRAELEQFAVGFSASEALPEGLYQLSHRTAGRCQLFLSADGKGATALFSLLR